MHARFTLPNLARNITRYYTDSNWLNSPKRRRTDRGTASPRPRRAAASQPSSDDSILGDDPRSASPSRGLAKSPFGSPIESSSISAIKERRAIIEFLDGYRAGRQHTSAIRSRLTNILKTTELWKTVGCQLCFASTGRLEPDHDMNSCRREADCKRVRSIFRWLESLDIPRSSSRGRGFCSTCAPFHPCGEVRMGYWAKTAEPPEERDYWIQSLESRPAGWPLREQACGPTTHRSPLHVR